VRHRSCDRFRLRCRVAGRRRRPRRQRDSPVRTTSRARKSCATSASSRWRTHGPSDALASASAPPRRCPRLHCGWSSSCVQGRL